MGISDAPSRTVSFSHSPTYIPPICVAAAGPGLDPPSPPWWLDHLDHADVGHGSGDIGGDGHQHRRILLLLRLDRHGASVSLRDHLPPLLPVLRSQQGLVSLRVSTPPDRRGGSVQVLCADGQTLLQATHERTHQATPVGGGGGLEGGGGRGGGVCVVVDTRSAAPLDPLHQQCQQRQLHSAHGEEQQQRSQGRGVVPPVGVIAGVHALHQSDGDL
mmetsp:Transcript_15167/g.33123  ORF Transcript_15167/g.33123 Transcript_15167/m.33123 type:complete len:216 (+) Transcript_15167:428-1075(+)